MPRGSGDTVIHWERSLEIDLHWLFSGEFSEETFSASPFKLEKKIHFVSILWNNQRLYNKNMLVIKFSFSPLHLIVCVPPLGMENTQRLRDTQFWFTARIRFSVWLLALFFRCGQYESAGCMVLNWTACTKTTTCHMTSHAAHSCAEVNTEASKVTLFSFVYALMCNIITRW